MKTFLRKLFSRTGIIATLFIGTVIGISVFKIEDSIKRQRYLELLQLEIRSNYLTAVDISNKKSNQGLIDNYEVFSSDVFKSGLASGYILTIPQDLLARMYAIYTVGVPRMNNTIDHQTALMEQIAYEWELCILDQSTNPDLSCTEEETHRKIAEGAYSDLLAYVGEGFSKELQSLSDNFNPTQDRLNSPFLSLFMGRETLGIQK